MNPRPIHFTRLSMNPVISSMKWLIGSATLSKNQILFIKQPEKVTSWDLLFIVLGTLFTVGTLTIIFVIVHICGYSSKQMKYLKKVKRYYGKGMKALEADESKDNPILE